MWAMIGCSIAMALWTTGLLYMTARAERKKEAESVRRNSVDTRGDFVPEKA